jgi:hypothetical protein
MKRINIRVGNNVTIKHDGRLFRVVEINSNSIVVSNGGLQKYTVSISELRGIPIYPSILHDLGFVVRENPNGTGSYTVTHPKMKLFDYLYLNTEAQRAGYLTYYGYEDHVILTGLHELQNMVNFVNQRTFDMNLDLQKNNYLQDYITRTEDYLIVDYLHKNKIDAYVVVKEDSIDTELYGVYDTEQEANKAVECYEKVFGGYFSVNKTIRYEKIRSSNR